MKREVQVMKICKREREIEIGMDRNKERKRRGVGQNKSEIIVWNLKIVLVF